MHISIANVRRARTTAVAAAATLGLTAAAPALAAVNYDYFTGHHGSTVASVILKQTGRKFTVGVTLQCSNASEDIPNTSVTSKGKFSFNGKAYYTRGSAKTERVTTKMDGSVKFSGKLSLSSAKSVNLSATSAGCKSFSGTAKHQTLPPVN
jgi:hypothetical protein